MAFCLEENVPVNRPEPDDIARCLLLFQYAVACHLRAALGFALPLWGCDVMVSSAPVLKRVVRGLWNRKPVLRRGTGGWDPSVVLSFLKSGGPTDWATDVKWLRGKAVTILALVTAARAQTLAALSLSEAEIGEDFVVFKIVSPLKQSRPDFHQSELRLEAFSPDPEICPVRALKDYLRASEGPRGALDSVFVTGVKPYRAASAGKVSRRLPPSPKQSLSPTRQHRARGGERYVAHSATPPVSSAQTAAD